MPEDPNKDRNDPMTPDYWTMGENLQDAIRARGYEHETVDGIAVDIHDILQAADAIRFALGQAASLEEQMAVLRFELDHIRWHCNRALPYLEAADGA